MSVHTRRCIAALAIAIAIATVTAACSPALNWRRVTLEGLEVLLPCKPDHANRKVQLGTVDAELRMSGCEAKGALYAISHIRVDDLTLRESSKNAWRQATFAAMQATAGTTAPSQDSSTQPNTPHAKLALNPEQVAGSRPDGSPVQAQIVWLTKGPDIYQVAVYASKLDDEKTELFFSELRLQ